MQAHERDFDESYAEVQAIYELVAQYALPVAALEMAAFHTLVPDFTAMRHAIDEVESAQDEQAQSYALELATGEVPQLCQLNLVLRIDWLPASARSAGLVIVVGAQQHPCQPPARRAVSRLRTASLHVLATCLPSSSKTCRSGWNILVIHVLPICPPSSSKRCQVC